MPPSAICRPTRRERASDASRHARRLTNPRVLVPSGTRPPDAAANRATRRQPHRSADLAHPRDARIAQNARPITRAARTSRASLMCRSRTASAGAAVSPAGGPLRDELAVSGQRLLAASGQIPMAAHRPTSACSPSIGLRLPGGPSIDSLPEASSTWTSNGVAPNPSPAARTDSPSGCGGSSRRPTVVVELRAARPQPRPATPPLPRRALPRHRRPNHRTTHRLPRPMEPCIAPIRSGPKS